MTQLLLAYDFPPIGGGIARMMGELARRYPPGSFVARCEWLRVIVVKSL